MTHLLRADGARWHAGLGRFGAPALAGALAMLQCTQGAVAGQPPMGGGMIHLVVDFDGVDMHVAPEGTGPLPLVRYEGQQFDGAAAVLDDRAFNSQFGWLVGGFWFPPAGTAVWIKRESSSAGLDVYAQGSFAPIHGTDGSPQAEKWNGVMLHNWYAADAPGIYHATYRVYLGDPITAEPLPEYGSATVSLSWSVEGASCLGDLNGDGAVNGADLGDLLAAWGQEGGAPDLDGSGQVGGADLGLLLGAWGACDPG